MYLVKLIPKQIYISKTTRNDYDEKKNVYRKTWYITNNFMAFVIN